jgi:hypothetical protein
MLVKSLHNYGTIQAYRSHFYNNYRFNAGVIKLGERPIAVTDLTEDLPEIAAEPRFKQHIVENYGQFISKGKYDVRGGLNYRELGESVMNDLEMSGGDISIFKGSMNVAGTLFGDVGRIAVIDRASSVYVNEFEKLPGDIRGVNGGILYTSDEEKPRLKKLEQKKERARMRRLGETIYGRYVRIRNGELLSEPERQTYKERYGRDWEEEAAQRHRWGLRGGGPVASVIVPIGIGALVGCTSKHGSVSVGVGTSGRVQVRAQNYRSCPREYAPIAHQQHEQRLTREDWTQTILEESMKRARLYVPVRKYVLETHRAEVAPPTRIRQAFDVPPAEAWNRRRLYDSIREERVQTRGPDTQTFLEGLHTQMIQKFEIPARDTRRILGDSRVTDSLDRMRRFNDYTTPSSSGTEVLRSLQRDAEHDRGWFQRYFNPTREEFLERVSRPSLVDRLVREHPWIVLGPAGLMWKPVHAALQTAGAIALRRVAPLLVAATADAGNYVYENLINYAKGGKDAVGKGGKGTGSKPKWRQSEIDVGKTLGPKARNQVSYLNGKEVRHGLEGSVRPDFVVGNKASFEVKNYTIATNKGGLIRDVVRQVKERAVHLPKGMKQEIRIDIRSQSVTPETRMEITRKIWNKTEGIVTEAQVKFIGPK